MYKLRYEVKGSSVFARISALLMGLAILFRLIGCWGFWKNRPPAFCYLQILIPIVCNILFIVLILKLGERAFTLTFIPVVLGAVYFIAYAVGLEAFWRKLLGVLLSLASAAVYTGTVFGKLRSKWWLLPGFAIPLLYQLLVIDGEMLRAADTSLSVGEVLPELSVLCMLIAMLLIVFAMKKKAPEELETVDGEAVVEEFSPEDLLPVKAEPEKPGADVTEEKTDE